VITTPAVLSAFTTAIAAPSVDSLSERFAATFVSFFRFSIAKSKSSLQPKLLQSIIPAPVAVLNLFTSAAVIVAMLYLFIRL
jgi:hypothetical protein